MNATLATVPAVRSVCRLEALLNQAALSIGEAYANKRKKMSLS